MATAGKRLIPSHTQCINKQTRRVPGQWYFFLEFLVATYGTHHWQPSNATIFIKHPSERFKWTTVFRPLSNITYRELGIHNGIQT
jgi:hypothetical protein